MHIQLLFSPPLVILFLFLIINFIVGSCFTKKATTFREYAIGCKQFATPTLIATILATRITGSDMEFTVREAHKSINNYLPYLIFEFLSYLYLAIVAMRVGPFIQQDLSIAESLGNIYGKKVRVVTACAYLGLSIATIVMELGTIYWVLSSCLGGLLDGFGLQWLTAVIWLVVIMYTTRGGAHAVAWTDVLQLMIFTTIIPLFILYTLMQTEKSGWEILTLLPVDKLKWKNPMSLPVGTIVEWFSSSILVFPEDIQRIYMAANSVQVVKSFVSAGFFWLLIVSCIHLAGIFASADLSLSTDVWVDLFSHMSAPWKVAMLCSILALSMSSIDSRLHVNAVLVNYDILPHIKSMQPIVAKHPIYVARVVILVIGITIFSIILLKPGSSIHYGSLYYGSLHALRCASAMVIVPTALAFWGVQGDGSAILIGMFTGLVVMVLGWKIWVELSIHVIYQYACLANVVAFFIARYLLPQRNSRSNSVL